MSIQSEQRDDTRGLWWHQALPACAARQRSRVSTLSLMAVWLGAPTWRMLGWAELFHHLHFSMDTFIHSTSWKSRLGELEILQSHWGSCVHLCFNYVWISQCNSESSIIFYSLKFGGSTLLSHKVVVLLAPSTCSGSASSYPSRWVPSLCWNLAVFAMNDKLHMLHVTSL